MNWSLNAGCRQRLTASIVVMMLIATSEATGQCGETKLLASDGAVADSFGNSVSISGDIAIVGARWDDDSGRSSGSAYIYRFNPDSSGWVEEAKLLASDGSGGDRFGWPVSISSAPGIPGNKVVIVGAMGNDDNGMISGSAYLFRFNPDTSEWTEEAKLLAPDAAALDAFGSFVAVSDDVAIVGAYGNDDYGSLSGSAYIFDLSRLGTCPVDTDCDGMVGVTELLGLLSAWGVCVPSCPFDFDGNYGVDVLDLLILIGDWGVCP